MNDYVGAVLNSALLDGLWDIMIMFIYTMILTFEFEGQVYILVYILFLMLFTCTGQIVTTSCSPSQCDEFIMVT